MKKTVAIITARGGSKRIPRKNIRNFAGQPIIAYSISAAIESGCFDIVMVSTDDNEIADIASSYGAEIPFIRSPETSDDFATTAEVLLEVLEQYSELGKIFIHACCIYPTAPFVTPVKLKKGFTLLIEKDADSVFPVVQFSFPIQRALKIKNNRLVMFQPEYLSSRSQDLEPAFHDAGQFYWFNVKRFSKHKKLLTDNSVPIIMPAAEVQDIDTEEDWNLAEIKFRSAFLKRH